MTITKSEHDTSGGARHNLTENTVQRLLTMIAVSSLKPGDPFTTEKALEKKFKISRSILREAISRLRALGFLKSRQYTGLIISKPDPVALLEGSLHTFFMDDLDLKELAEIRYTLEIGAVELAVERATEKQVEQLHYFADEYAKTLTEEKLSRSQDEIELDFHRTIFEMTHNDMLSRMANVLTVFFSRMSKELPGWEAHTQDEQSAWEHRAIAQAFADGSDSRARAILSGHLRRLPSPNSLKKKKI